MIFFCFFYLHLSSPPLLLLLRVLLLLLRYKFDTSWSTRTHTCPRCVKPEGFSQTWDVITTQDGVMVESCC